MATRLTHKEKGFVKDIVKGKTGTEAAMNNYDIQGKDPENVAASIASENLTKPKIQQAIQDALPDELLAQIHREGLFATKPIFSKEGDLVSEEADFSTRHKYLDSAYKIKGTYAPIKSANLNANIDLSTGPDDIDLDLIVKEAESKLKQQKLNG